MNYNKEYLPDIHPATKRLRQTIKEIQKSLNREKNEIRDVLNKWWERKVDKFAETLKKIEELEKKHGYKITKNYKEIAKELKLSNK